MPDLVAQLAENVARVRGRSAEAARRSGRPAEAVALVAVTKYVSADVTRRLVEAGCRELGESRPQLLWEKAAALADLPIRWHLIGRLQRNKVRRTLQCFDFLHVGGDSCRRLGFLQKPIVGGDSCRRLCDETPDIRRQESPPTMDLHPRPKLAMLHSLENERLLAAIEAEQLPPVPALLEVNISGDAAKQGLLPDAVEPFLVHAAASRGVSIVGLMGMAGLESDTDAARREFASLRELRDRLRGKCPPGVTLDELSMGMSGDFEAAIEEGATIVRVGSALFEGVDFSE